MNEVFDMCTSVIYENQNNEFFLARTMDFSIPLSGKPIFIPKDFVFYKAQSKKTFSSSYHFVGAGRLVDEYVFGDGVNEKGLSVASLYFSDDAVYQEPKNMNELQLAPHDVVAWLLGTCETVAEVTSKIKEISIVAEVSPVINGVLPLHWLVADKTGASIVIEPVKQGLEIYENTVQVMANSPSFPWHLTNLNQYPMLSNISAPSSNYHEFIAKGNGAGSGAVGLPGDYTSISRFVRIAFMNQYCEKGQTPEESINIISRMLSAVYIPKGVKLKSNGAIDYTQFTSFMDLERSSYVINYYENNRFLQIDLKDLVNRKEPKVFETGQEMTFEKPII